MSDDRAIVDAATPGPWAVAQGTPDWGGPEVVVDEGIPFGHGHMSIAEMRQMDEQARHNATFTATFTPVRVSRLLDVVEAVPDDGELGHIAALLTSQSLPLDMNPMRDRLVRKVRALRVAVVALDGEA